MKRVYESPRIRTYVEPVELDGVVIEAHKKKLMCSCGWQGSGTFNYRVHECSDVAPLMYIIE